MPAPTIKVGRQYRSAAFVRENVNLESRTAELAFSSETPVERWFGKEILGHGNGECNLEWLSSGRAPFLVDHNTRQQIGVVQKAWIGNDSIGRAVVRFGKSERAEQELQDCAAGIRVNVSVGYDLDELELVEAGGDPDEEADSTYRAKWTPWEISTVAIPADTAVGVGREPESHTRQVPVRTTTVNQRTQTMTETVPAPAVPPVVPAPIVQAAGDTAELLRGERQRVADITALGARHQKKDLADKAIADGTSLDAFRGLLLAAIPAGTALETPKTDLGLSQRDAQSYSLTRMLRAQMDAPTTSGGAQALAPFELECHAEISKRLGRAARGIFVPLDAQRVGYPAPMSGQRDLVVGTGNAGGYVVDNELRPQDFITLLRNRMMVKAMGATILSGLSGNVLIPKHTGAGTAYWISENGAPTESQQTLAQVSLTPKTVAAYTDYSRLLLLQSSLAVEGFVRDDLSQILAIAIDLAAIHGSGTSNEPTGIVATSGIGSVAGGDNGLAPAWSHIVGLETAVAVANADFGNTGYLTNASVRGKLKTVDKASGAAQFIWGDGMGMPPGFGSLNGYKAGVSNQVSRTLTKGSASAVCSAILFGNWSDLLIGEWGILDLLVNPYTGAAAGTVRVHAFQSMDVAVRRAESFAAMLDALTT